MLRGVSRPAGPRPVLALRSGYNILGFVGLVTFETIETIIQPWRRLRLAALFHQIEETGLTALPILGLLSFLLGVVLAYQGADQLRRFWSRGVHGQSRRRVGAARDRRADFGDHRGRPVGLRLHGADRHHGGERRARRMETLGLNTIEVLVLPRVLGLVITLPLLTFYADLMGLIGGAVMSYFDLGHHRSGVHAPAAGRRHPVDLLRRADQGAGLRLHHRAGRLL